ncbi:MAG TPA: hypothetical protein VK507_13570, partial [Iamia sp.]|nr:hypothetical protein [Iamia sp.]
MTVAPQATELGSGCWRVDVDVEGYDDGAPVALDRFALVGRGSDDPPGLIAAAPVPGTRTHWCLLVQVPAGAEASTVDVTLDHALIARVPLRPEGARRPPVDAYGDVDYTARDFTALTAMLTGLVTATSAAAMTPGGVASPVPQAVALIEEIAYLGDALSYQLDAVATEAHLSTARQRTSVTRHAAALGYPVDQGANARVWVRFEVSAGPPVSLAEGSPVTGVLHRDGGDHLVVFETMHEVTLHPEEPVL